MIKYTQIRMERNKFFFTDVFNHLKIIIFINFVHFRLVIYSKDNI